MTAARFAGRCLEQADLFNVRVELGSTNEYRAGERVLTLRPDTFRATHSTAHALAAHEVGHAIQCERFGWLVPMLCFLALGRLLVEWDATRRAIELINGLGYCGWKDEETLRACYRTYLVPACWQTAAMVVLAVWLAVR